MNIRRNLIQYFQLTDAIGWLAGTRLFFKGKTKRNYIYQTSIPGYKAPISLRGNTFDINTFRQVFVNQEYNFKTKIQPKVIIDGGANIGFAAIYFSIKYPDAKIISVEPDDSNYALLVKNTKAYKNITCLKAGIWNKPAHLEVEDTGLGHWGFTVREVTEATPTSIYSVSINKLMEDYQLTELDIVKLDIEGSEKEVFTSDYDPWMSKTKILIVELHDRMKKGTSKALFNALNTYDFDAEQLGENLLCINNALVSQPVKNRR